MSRTSKLNLFLGSGSILFLVMSRGLTNYLKSTFPIVKMSLRTNTNIRTVLQTSHHQRGSKQQCPSLNSSMLLVLQLWVSLYEHKSGSKSCEITIGGVLKKQLEMRKPLSTTINQVHLRPPRPRPVNSGLDVRKFFDHGLQ